MLNYLHSFLWATSNLIYSWHTAKLELESDVKLVVGLQLVCCWSHKLFQSQWTAYTSMRVQLKTRVLFMQSKSAITVSWDLFATRYGPFSGRESFGMIPVHSSTSCVKISSSKYWWGSPIFFWILLKLLLSWSSSFSVWREQGLDKAPQTKRSLLLVWLCLCDTVVTTNITVAHIFDAQSRHKYCMTKKNDC